jgi:hypothetical protein
MSYTFYKIVHLVGILMIFLGYGALIARGMIGSNHSGVRKLGSITSGVGLFLALVAGFGLIAKLQLGFPVWVIIKIGIWVLVGAMITIILRKPRFTRPLWWALIFFAICAAWLAVRKPF